MYIDHYTVLTVHCSIRKRSKKGSIMVGDWFRALFRRVPVSAPNGLEFTVRLSPNANERMHKLMEKLGTKDMADIVRDALRVFEYVVNSELSGVEFYAKKTGDRFPQLHEFLREDEDDGDEGSPKGAD